MMMFASDLDRTLIFSKRALEQFHLKEDLELIPVEYKLGEEMSYMTKRSYELLQEISNQLLFVPVTTRSVEQYKRVALFPAHYQTLYAVTSNGANILYKDEIDMEWNLHIRQQIKDMSLKKEELIFLLENTYQISGELKIVEDLFFYFILKEPFCEQTFKQIFSHIKSGGWKVSLQGRKLYFMPESVSKGKAIKYIQDRERKTTLFGAGDSVLDDDFLVHCHHRFVPSHGELVHRKTLNAEEYTVTRNEGAISGEEVLSTILNLIEKN